MSRRRNGWRDERGVSLVLVLVTLVIFGLIVPVLGQFGSANGVSGYVLKGNRFDRYAAEAGMQGAIQWAQSQAQRQAGRQGTKCPDISTANLNSTDGPNASRTVTVQCAGFDTNGLPEATASIPAYALQTTNGSIAVNGNGSLRTDGAWWSDGSINVSPPSPNAFDATADYVGARSGCSNFIAAPKDCGTGIHRPTPSFAPTLSPNQIVVDRPNANPCGVVGSDGVARIPAGLHWQRALFTDLGDGTCANVSRILLEPGPHVFDFTQYGDRSDHNAWTLDASVTLTNHDGPCTASAPVLFGASFVLIAKGGSSIDLCSPPEAASQHVSMSTVVGDVVQNGTVARTTAPSSWRSDFNGIQSAPPASTGPLQTNECRSNRPCAPDNYIPGHLQGSRDEGSLTMTIPDPVQLQGAQLSTLTLTVNHTESNDNDIASSRIWVSGLGGAFGAASCDLLQTDNALDTAGDWRLDTFTCDLSSIHEPYFPNPNGLTVTYDVQLKPGNHSDNSQRSADVSLDSVNLSANASPAAFRSTNGSGTIFDLERGAQIRTDGTVNLPDRPVTLDFNGATGTTFGRGLVVGSAVVSGLPAPADFTPFSLPNGGNYGDRLATFRAFLGTDTSDATKAVLTARVRFCDAHPDGDATNVSTECQRTDATVVAPAKILAWDPKR